MIKRTYEELKNEEGDRAWVTIDQLRGNFRSKEDLYKWFSEHL